MTTISPKNPLREVEKNNPWYNDDQFLLQMENPAVQKVILARWAIFRSVIDQYTAPLKANHIFQILDAGCGDGINLIGLDQIKTELGLNCEIHACDYNQIRLERAKRFSFIKSFKEADLLKMPYEDDSFDIILCNHVLEHIPDMEKALAEIKRILKPGGKAILNVPNEGCLMAQIRNNILQRKILKTTDHVHFLTKSSFGKFIRNAGLNIERFERRGFFIPYLPLHSYIRIQKWGEHLENMLARIFPSQGTDLVAITTKEA